MKIKIEIISFSLSSLLFWPLLLPLLPAIHHPTIKSRVTCRLQTTAADLPATTRKANMAELLSPANTTIVIWMEAANGGKNCFTIGVNIIQLTLKKSFFVDSYSGSDYTTREESQVQKKMKGTMVTILTEKPLTTKFMATPTVDPLTGSPPKERNSL